MIALFNDLSNGQRRSSAPKTRSKRAVEDHGEKAARSAIFQGKL
jgi:hypothetical protein